MPAVKNCNLLCKITCYQINKKKKNPFRLFLFQNLFLCMRMMMVLLLPLLLLLRLNKHSKIHLLTVVNIATYYSPSIHWRTDKCTPAYVHTAAQTHTHTRARTQTQINRHTQFIIVFSS